jgi:putative endonuclease
MSARTHDYYVYIMTNRSYTSLYTGVTSDLPGRVWQHRNEPTGFAKRYRTNILVYFQPTSDVWAALAREEQVKNMHRADKIKLIETLNPEWHDLYETRVAPTPRQILSETG